MSLEGKRHIRILLFFLFAMLIVLGPFYRQALGGNNKIFRNWIMFAGKALGVVDAKFYLFRDGVYTEIDRYEILNAKKEPKNRLAWLIKDRRQLTNLEKKICSRIKSGNLRVWARVATRSGWRTFRRKEQRACHFPKKAVRRAKPHK